MRKTQSGFTLIEILVAFAIVGLLMGLTLPAASKMYDAMKYHDAVRLIVSGINKTRNSAISSGEAVDFIINPENREVRVGAGAAQQLDETISITATTAREVGHGGGNAVIRFYPDGSATGGTIDVLHQGGKAVRLRVDWLLGKLTQEAYVPS